MPFWLIAGLIGLLFKDKIAQAVAPKHYFAPALPPQVTAPSVLDTATMAASISAAPAAVPYPVYVAVPSAPEAVLTPPKVVDVDPNSHMPPGHPFLLSKPVPAPRACPPGMSWRQTAAKIDPPQYTCMSDTAVSGSAWEIRLPVIDTTDLMSPFSIAPSECAPLRINVPNAAQPAYEACQRKTQDACRAKGGQTVPVHGDDPLMSVCVKPVLDGNAMRNLPEYAALQRKCKIAHGQNPDAPPRVSNLMIKPWTLKRDCFGYRPGRRHGDVCVARCIPPRGK